MTRTFVLALLTSLALPAGSVLAQGLFGEDAPDVRAVEPFMMLVIDTSGSMEKLPVCSDCPTCNKCQPNCELVNNDSDPLIEKQKKNRWAVALEALTGTFENFECEALNRTLQNGMSYDIGYSLSYHQPWNCGGGAPGSACPYFGGSCTTDSDCISGGSHPLCVSGRCQAFRQDPDRPGVLDVYKGQVRFGLMTFDGWDTYFGFPPLIAVSDFNVALSESKNGLWSYGGPKEFHYPNCTTDFMMDTGARSSLAEEGRLISITQGVSLIASNTAIQDALLRTRPYGGTPIAASLDDLYYHLKNDMEDSFAQCRGSYALLMTDGLPDDDYRKYKCDCTHNDPLGDPATYCGLPGPLTNPADMKCPYPMPEQAARDLVFGKPGETPKLERLFVVGLAIDDTTVEAKLDAIALEGGSNEALLANDVDALVAQIGAILDNVIKPVSRAVPAFVSGTTVPQFQITAGFESRPTGLRGGLIERRRFLCDTFNSPDDPVVEADLDRDEGDLFHVVLDEQASRNLVTVLPSNDPNVNDGHLFRASGQPCGVAGCTEVALSTASFAQLAVNTGDEGKVLDWMYGEGDSVRDPSTCTNDIELCSPMRLGEIRHSSPIVVGTPDVDTDDEAFNIWRRRLWGATTDPGPAGRPLMLYLGSNDGILHGFSVEDWAAAPPSTESLIAGEEVFGFVPPLLLDDLQTNLGTNQFTMDGTVVVKNVYFQRETLPEATADNYRTVLVTGMRNGGHSYVALDVTDPLDPQFLWQFTDAQMGLTFAQPAVVQAIYTRNVGGSNVVRERAVAILPGGVGELGDVANQTECPQATVAQMPNPVTGQPFQTKNTFPEGNPHSHRSHVRCWKPTGRALYFVDVETGELIKKIHLSGGVGSAPVFRSPLVSTPAVYRDGIGTLASRAFVVDADGVIWRIDMSATSQLQGDNDPNTGWVARPFHDIFWDRSPTQGELSYEAPILSTDLEGQLVVIVGTGDTNDFTKDQVQNRVVSLTETLNLSLGTGPERWQAKFNWEKRTGQSPTKKLVTSELVTGPMVLFDEQLYFGTFISFNPGGEACDLGKGRLFGVHYREIGFDPQGNPMGPNGAQPETYAPRELDVASADDAHAVSLFNILDTQAEENFLVMGLALTTRPNCFIVDSVDSNVLDPLSGGKMAYAGRNPGGTATYLVAQASGTWDQGGPIATERRGVTSRFGSIELEVKRRTPLMSILSWATSVD